MTNHIPYKRWLKPLILTVIFAGFCGGCGQRADLVLPQDEPEAVEQTS